MLGCSMGRVERWLVGDGEGGEKIERMETGVDLFFEVQLD